MKTRKRKTRDQLAEAQFIKAGFGPKGTREWDYMNWAYARGYEAAMRRARR